MRLKTFILISYIISVFCISLVSLKAELSEGKGLAGKLKSSSDLVKHPSVIFLENFELPGFKSRWDEARDPEGQVLSIVDPENDSLGMGCLKVTASLGVNTGGGLTKWFKSSDKLFVRFYTKFDSSSDYIHHFVTLRGNKSLTGRGRWSGFGGAGLKPNGSMRFSTALEPWGNWGRNPAPGKWNFYSYWHEMKPSPDGKYWGNSFKPKVQSNIKKSEWICAEFMMLHNNPGKRDGEQAFWINGELKGHWRGISWRTNSSLMANALTLESYVTDRWTKNKINIVYFDDLVVATEYIGPKY